MKLASFCLKNEDGLAETLEMITEFDSPQTLIILFGDSSYREESQLLQQVTGACIHSKVIGCSTAGEVLGQTISQKSLVGAIVKFDKTEVRVSYAGIESDTESLIAGKTLAAELNQSDLKGILILSDGLNVNGTKLIEGINSVLPQTVVVTGGLAGDNANFTKTWVMKNGTPESNVVSAVGFYGESVEIGHGSKGGWDIFGPERRVTKSIDNELFELDGKPALQLYKEYLGEKAAGLPASALLFPLALRTSEADEKQIVRTILSINEERQSMIFAGDIPQNSFVQLMRANFDRLIDGASEAAIMTREKAESEKDILSIAISCVGRRLILGERAEEELEAVMDYLPRNTTQVGFYSYGEISPYASGYCDLHNQTMTLTTISEN